MQIYNIDSLFSSLASALWGTPLVLLLGGGLYFAIIIKYSNLYFKHAIQFLLGKYDSEDDQVKLPILKHYLVLGRYSWYGKYCWSSGGDSYWRSRLYFGCGLLRFWNEYKIFCLYSCCNV